MKPGIWKKNVKTVAVWFMWVSFFALENIVIHDESVIYVICFNMLNWI